jgi:hypothetical protein
VASDYNKVTISGTLPGGEEWSINPNFVGPSGTGGAVTLFSELQQWSDAIAAVGDLGPVPEPIGELISSGASVNTIRVAAYQANGDIITVAETQLGTPGKGTTNVTKPLQTALVVSLLTGRPGRSYNGRLYLPALGAILDTATARVPAFTVQAYLDGAKTMLQSIQTAQPDGAGMQLCVVSHKLEFQTPVTALRIGDVLDTQRRRRESLVENYTSESY